MNTNASITPITPKTPKTFEILETLTKANGVSGDENSIANVALELLKNYAPDAHIDNCGSVVATIGEGGENVPTIMLDAHIDQVGLIVTEIGEDGFVKASSCGGIDTRVLAAQKVTFHSGSGSIPIAPDVSVSPIKGIISTLPPHASKDKGDGGGEKAIKSDEIWIDTGLSKERAEQLISLGDTVTIDSSLKALSGDLVCGQALDDRAGVCAILHSLECLRNISVSSISSGINGAKINRPLIKISFSTKEEVGCIGAGITAYNAEPDYAIAVDVSYAKFHGCSESDYSYGEIGKGPMIGYSPTLNRTMFEDMKKAATDSLIPYQLEIMRGKTGTNADPIGIVKGGIKTSLLSIPLRYMHTPVETASLSDIENVGRLIAAFINRETNNK